jgi:hypothetical protein
MATVPFISVSSGKDSGRVTAVEGALTPGDRVEINGSVDLSTYMVGHSGARGFSIEMVYQAKWANEYAINVVAQGPAGFFSGLLDLAFVNNPHPDKGPAYEIVYFDINSSTKKQHTVPYHSDRPAIYTIDWSHRRWYSL